MDIRPIDANALWKRCSDLYDRYDNIFCAYEEIDNAPTLSLNTLRDAIYQDAVAHGLWEEDVAYPWDDCYEMIKDEVVELENAADDYEYGDGDIDHVCEELADVIILCFSVAGAHNVDIDAAIRRKMEINKNRPWKHGKEGKA